MASAEQLNSYHAQCSSVSFSAFNFERSLEYDPADADYYEDVIEDNGNEGSVVGSLSFIMFMSLVVFSIIACCLPHHWLKGMDFIGIARNGRCWWKRLLALLFLTAIVCCTFLVVAMSIWGIVKVEQDARDVVPESFDFMESTRHQLRSIYYNLRAAVENGNRIVGAVRVAAAEVQRDQAALQLRTVDGEFNETIVEVIDILLEASETAEDALVTVDEEINENLDDILDGLRDAVGYRDEGEGYNTAGRIVIIVAFSFFMLFAIGALLLTFCGASPKMTLTWAAVMWLMLTVAFWCVSVLDITKEISRETCLYIDTYAVAELRDEVRRDPERTEALIWYYFRGPNNRNKNLTELEELWSFPLTEVVEFLDIAEREVFDGEVLRFPYNLAEAPTQQALIAVRNLVPRARKDISFVQDLIAGETLHKIHSDFKDLVCCTEYDALNSVWQAWVVSSAFGLMIAVMMTIQGFLSFKCGREAVVYPAEAVGAQTVKTSAYMAPPVAEGVFHPASSDVELSARNGSGTPLRNNNEQSSATVAQPTVVYPTIQPIKGAAHF